MNARRSITFVQTVVALGALLWLLSQVEWSRIETLAGMVQPVIVLAVLAVTGLEFVTRFSMWHVLFRARHTTPFATAANVDLVVKFVNHVIPSKASGHSIAPLVINHLTPLSWTESATVAGVNTGLYASLYGALSLLGIFLFASRLPPGLLVVLGLSTALYLAIGVAILTAGRRLDATTAAFERMSERVDDVPGLGSLGTRLVRNIPSFTEDSAAIFRDLTASPKIVLLYALGWAGTLMIVPGIRVWLLLDAFVADFAPAIAIPLVLVMAYSVTLLPLTPGGVGIAEASASLVFVALGVPESVAVSVVLLDRLLGVYLPALIGWYPVTRIDLAEVIARGK